MTHSIEVPIGRPMSSQAIATTLVAATMALNPDLPKLEWSIAPDGSVRGTHAKATSAEVSAALTAWAALFGESLRVLGSCRADRQTYGVEIVHGAVPVFLSGVGTIETPVLPAELAHIEQPDPANHRLSGEGLTQAQLHGAACGRCGLMYPKVSTPIGYVPGEGQVFACDPACPPSVAPVGTCGNCQRTGAELQWHVPGMQVCGRCADDEQPDPTDPATDDPQPHASWHQAGDGRYERAVIGVLWAVEMLDDTEINPTDPGPGAYMYAPRSWPGDGVSRVGLDLTAGLLAADSAIAEWSVAQAAAVAEWAARE